MCRAAGEGVVLLLDTWRPSFPIYLKAVFSPRHVFGTCVDYQMTASVCLLSIALRVCLDAAAMRSGTAAPWGTWRPSAGIPHTCSSGSGLPGYSGSFILPDEF